jgi:hypothetical protein
MNGERTPPPSVGDVLSAAAACGWPAVDSGEIVIDAGEDAWRAAMTPALAEAVWAAWHDDDDTEEPGDDDEGGAA